MPSNTNEIIAARQQDIRSALDALVPTTGKIALLDFPNHGNVGDSAIYLGAIEYFRKIHNRKPDYLCDIPYYVESELRQTIGNGTIFLHGGGNFGDIWPHFQVFRKTVLETFTDNPIVQMPQSIHFDHEENIEESKKYINAHPNFTLLVRDHKSLEFAQKHYTCNIALCPDMAFFMGALTTDAEKTCDIFGLMRTDKEKYDSGEIKNDEGLKIEIQDWLEEDPDLYDKTKKALIPLLPFKLGLKALDKFARRELLYRTLAEKRLDRGLRMLGSGRVVVTDRLHAHILSLLLDLPHVRMDNSYGKISGFAKAWTADSNICVECTNNMGEAIEKAKALGLA